MVNKPKRQGTALETWIVDAINSAPLTRLRAQRLAEGGSKDLGDVEVIVGDDTWVLEAKANAALNATRALGNARKKNTEGKTALVWKRLIRKEGKKVRVPDGERVVVVLAWEDFLELLEASA